MIFLSHVVGCLWCKVGSEWIKHFIKDESSDYISSLYWSVTTMLTVGYGDIVAITNGEKVYAIFTMLLGCCLFAYVMSSIGGLVNEISNNKMRTELRKLNEYLENKPIDESFKMKLRKYYEQLYRQQKSSASEGLALIS
jgi:hypothetical protein